MQMIVVPYVGVGPLKFGMTREEVRKLFPEPPDVLEQKTSLDDIPMETFRVPNTEGFVQCEYKKPGVLQLIALTKEADPAFRGKHLFNLTYQELITWLREIDPNCREGQSMLFLNVGIAVGEPVDPEEECADYIGVFERDYYS